jgi:hypothetical protein
MEGETSVGRIFGHYASIAGAVIYVRLSTKKQTENLSLPTQLCR